MPFSEARRRTFSTALLWGAAIVTATVVVYLAGRSGPGAPPPSGEGSPATTAPTGAATPNPPREVPQGIGLSEPLPLGAVRPASYSEGDACPAGSSCDQTEITCPGVEEPARVTIATAPPSGDARGLVVFLSGGGGRDWWADEGSTAAFLEDVRSEGFALVQLRWKDEWLGAPDGERAGPERLACRPATALAHIHRTIYPRFRADAPAEPGRCGFCVTGTSGGASQLAYALSFYGLDEIVDAAIPTGGPPHAALDRGCNRDPEDQAYWYEGASVRTIDASWGFRSGAGPCVTNDATWTEPWQRSSVDLGGSDYVHPRTRVHVIVGERDRVLPHAQDYVARLHAEGSPRVELQIVPNMGHSIAKSDDGLAALLRVLLA
jgi:hypothetical protein